MSVIQLTGSTSVIFVDTNTASSTVLLPPIGFQSRFITIKDSTGNAKNNPITVSTTGNYLFNGTGYTNQNGENIAAVSTITINQNYASVTVSSAIPNKLNPSTSWILQNTYAFEDRYPIAQLDTLNCSNGNFSTISTINFQALNFQAASNAMCNSQILSASISCLNVTDLFQVDKALWVIPSTSSIGIGAYPSTGWALDLAFDARIRSTLSVQQALFVGTSNFYAGLGRVGAQCNAPRYTLDVAGTTFVASNLLVGSTFSVNSGRTTIGNSTPGAYLDVYGNVFVRSSMTVASTLYVGQSTLGVGLNSIYMNGPLLLNASLGPETLLISTSGIGTMFQMGSNGQTANLYFTGVGQGPTNAYMSFLSSGQLGVNCNFPQTYLDVGGGALIAGNLNVTSSISTLVISSGKAYVGDYVGSTMQIGDSAYINVLSSGTAFISSLSAGYAYIGSLSSAQTAIGIVSAGQGYIGALSNFAISSANVSVGQGYVGSLSNASFSSLMISAGQSYIDSISGRSLSSMVQSTGTSFIGILTSLSVNTSTLNSYSGIFNNFLGLSLQMSSISTHSIVGAIGNIRQLLVSSIKVGITTDNDVLDVTGNAVISQTLTTSNLTVKDFTTLTSNVNIYGNVQYIAGISKTFKIDNTYSTLMNGTAGNVAFGIGTNTPRAGLDVQTQVNMSSANIGILSTGSLIINSLTTGTVIGCNDIDVSLRSYGTSELSNAITVGAVDINSRNIFYNFTDFQRDVNANYISSGSAYIGSAYISTLSSANIFVRNISVGSAHIGSAYISTLSSANIFATNISVGSAYIGSAYISTLSSANIFATNISAGNLVQTIGPGFSSLSSVIWSNFSTLSSYINNRIPTGTAAGEFLSWNGTSWVAAGSAGIAVGALAGSLSQGEREIAIGKLAGNSSQGEGAIAIGFNAAPDQNTNAIAIGSAVAEAGIQGIGSVAVGSATQTYGSGAYAIGIGAFAGRPSLPDETPQDTGSIVINASGNPLGSAGNNTLVIKPIRNDSGPYPLSYNPTTYEVTAALPTYAGIAENGGTLGLLGKIGPVSGNGLLNYSLTMPIVNGVQLDVRTNCLMFVCMANVQDSISNSVSVVRISQQNINVLSIRFYFGEQINDAYFSYQIIQYKV